MYKDTNEQQQFRFHRMPIMFVYVCVATRCMDKRCVHFRNEDNDYRLLNNNCNNNNNSSYFIH